MSLEPFKIIFQQIQDTQEDILKTQMDMIARLSKQEEAMAHIQLDLSNHLTEITVKAEKKSERSTMWKIAAFASITSLSTVIVMFILALMV